MFEEKRTPILLKDERRSIPQFQIICDKELQPFFIQFILRIYSEGKK